jgi:hypothetical protein
MMKPNFLSVLCGLVLMASPLSASTVLNHVDDTHGILSDRAAGALEGRLAQFEHDNHIRVLVELHAKSPGKAEDSQPGAYMRALARKRGVIGHGVLAVYFADEPDWRVWIGDDLAPKFAGRPGTAEELTKSGAMHDAKEAWLKDVLQHGERAWRQWNQVPLAKPKPSDKIGFEANAIVDGLDAKFAPPGAD